MLSVSRQGVIYGIVVVIASHMIGYHGVLAAQAVSDSDSIDGRYPPAET